MQHNAPLEQACESCNIYDRYRFGFTCDICSSQVCNMCTYYCSWHIYICDLCVLKAFLIKITLPGGYNNVSRYEKSVGRINISGINLNKSGVGVIQSGTCTVCKRNIPVLKSNYASLRVHYKQKNKVRFICDGSRKLCLEIRREALAGDMGRKKSSNAKHKIL